MRVLVHESVSSVMRHGATARPFEAKRMRWMWGMLNNLVHVNLRKLIDSDELTVRRSP